MKKFIQQRGLSILFVMAFAFLSCDKEEGVTPQIPSESTPNIIATAQATDALSSLVAALSKADEKEGIDLIGTLSGEGPFTVFAPTNDAFTALLGGLEGYDSLEDFDTDEEKDLLAQILTYHVISGTAAFSSDLGDGQSVVTVQGEQVGISLNNGVFIEDATDVKAQVTLPDVETSNGVVHIVDKVLVPQAVLDALSAGMENTNSDSLVDIVVATEPLSILEAAVIKAGLVETLNGEGPFTVFAPTDDAFIALLDILGDNYNGLEDFDTDAEIALLTDILLYHVVPAKVLAADLSPSEVATALSDNTLEIIASRASFVIGDASSSNANITGTDIMASNGVAHTIDKVLLPQSAIDFVASLSLKSIVEIAVATDDVSVLVEALIQSNAGLVDVLSGAGPFTVFAPDNHAFQDLFETLGDDFHSIADFDTEEEKALLTKVLTYHVVSGTAAFSTTLSNGQKIATVQGEEVGISITNGMVHIDDATDSNASVTLPDVEANNGVVHIINKVLLPQEVLDALSPSLPNIVGLAQSVDGLSLLVDALIQADAGLVEVLSGEGPFTVFAPTNEAFESLLHTLGSEYNSISDFDTHDERELLAKILKYHVIAGAAATAGDLQDHQQLHTVQGEAIVTSVGSTVKIIDKTSTKAKVTGADNLASNGVVHLIDKVLLPQEVLNILNH